MERDIIVFHITAKAKLYFIGIYLKTNKWYERYTLL